MDRLRTGSGSGIENALDIQVGFSNRRRTDQGCFIRQGDVRCVDVRL